MGWRGNAMRASILGSHGGPEVLQLSELPAPVPQPGETLIRVGAAGVEPGLDVRTRLNGAGWQLRFPHVLGASMAGTVVSSPDAAAPDPGTRIAVAPNISCGECAYCRSGRDNSCAQREFLGIHHAGGYAEFCSVPTRNLIPIADTTSFAVASSTAVSFGTAWHLLVTRARVSPADVVFVVGAAGSVGTAAAQIAALFGARVILGSRTPQNLRELADEVRALGVVDTTTDLSPQLESIAPGGVDVVVETVGSETWAGSVAALAPEGRLVCCGGASGGEVGLTLRDLYRRNLSLLFSTSSTFEDLRLVFRLVDEGRLRPRVDTVFDLADAAAAHAAVEAGGLQGKVVIVPESAA